MTSLRTRKSARPETVRAVERASRIIRALAERPYSMTVRELAARAGLSSTSVHRMLTTLVAIGWAHQNSNTGRYRLGTEILGVGSSGLITDPVIQNGRAFLQRFAEATGHTCFLSTLVGGRVVYLARVEGALVPAFSFEPGLSMPAHAMADGKLLLAHLPQPERDYLYRVEEFRSYTPRTTTEPEALEAEFAAIRASGYAVEQGQRFERFWGLAVPVIWAEGRLSVAMLCIGTGELSPASEAEKHAQMVSTVEALSDHLALVGDLPRPAVDFARHNLE
jgi:DNA-binding IclR family transcriptional regulator